MLIMYENIGEEDILLNKKVRPNNPTGVKIHAGNGISPFKLIFLDKLQ